MIDFKIITKFYINGKKYIKWRNYRKMLVDSMNVNYFLRDPKYLCTCCKMSTIIINEYFHCYSNYLL